MKRDIMRILSDWNVWWERKEVPEDLLGRERDKSKELVSLLRLREIKIVTGVRRSGKSTLLYQVIGRLLKNGTPPKNILLINFEDAALAHYSLDEIYESFSPSLTPSLGTSYS